MIDRKVFSNASLLYLRMLIMMCLTLINTKFLLKFLGIENFGIYSLVWGLVLIMGFFNNSITSAVQRFLNIAIAQNDTQKLINIYSVSTTIFLGLGIILILVLLLIKDILFSRFLNIPNNKLSDASYVYYFMTAGFFANFISLNYHSSLVATERFSFYAIITIFESLLKLISTILLFLVSNKLLYYSLFLSISSYIVLAILIIYCKYYIYFCRFKFVNQWFQYRKILNFISWNLLGSLGVLISIQGIPLIANIFYGVTINASLNISNQLSSLIGTVTSNFQKAFSPYLMKSFVSEPGSDLKVIALSKISVFFYSLVAMPLIFYTEYVLEVWLSRIPEYVPGIVRISAVIALFEVLAGPLWMLIQAEGNIKFYQLSVLFIMLLTTPLSYILFLHGFSIYHVWYMLLLANTILFSIRVIFVSKILNKNFIKKYINKLIIRVVLFLIIGSCISYYLSLVSYNFLSFILLNLLSSLALTILAIYLLANTNERLIIKFSTLNILSKIRKKI